MKPLTKSREGIPLNSDFRDLLSLFNQYGIRYLVVGGYAVMYYTEPRYTKNLDIVVGTLPNELGAIRSALAEFGFPMSDKAAAELAVPNRMIKIGHPPGRLDILNEIEGVDFDQAWERRVVISLDGVNAPFIALSDLVAAKRAAGRPQDLLDLAKLEKVGED